ncbi:MAG: hypothetical protein NC406_06755 [Bacteroides sp.]|nr:hypothetical protein [Bacteroides sp.]
MKSIIARYGPAVAACYCVLAVALWVWPGAGWYRAGIGFTLALAVTGAAYAAVPCRSRAGAMLLLAVATALFVGAVTNVNFFTLGSGGTAEWPYFQNVDAFDCWGDAMRIVERGPLPVQPEAYATALLMYTLGHDAFTALMPGLLSALLSIVITGAIAGRLTGRRDIALGSMLALSLMCYFMVQATVLIKDVPLALGMALGALALVRLDGGSRGPATWLAAVAAVVVMAVYRPNTLNFLALGALIFAVRRRGILPFAGVAAMAVAARVGVMYVLSYIPATYDSGMSDMYIAASGSGGGDGTVDSLLAAYPAMPVWKRLMLLPATVVMQFLIPFPWDWASDRLFGPTVPLAHCQYTWYAAGALLVYWAAVLARRSPAPMVRLGLWAAACYIITAYLFAGRISRYALPLLPLMMPMVAYTATVAWRRRSLRVWLAVFALGMTATLLICHKIHMG